MRHAGQVARIVEWRVVYGDLRVKPEGKRKLGRTMPTKADNIKVDLQEVGYGGMDWIEMAQDRESLRVLVNVVMNLPIPESVGISLTSSKPVSVSRRTVLCGVSR
jgi:hypothetical protein